MDRMILESFKRFISLNLTTSNESSDSLQLYFGSVKDSYLVDPASSHMLVSKIKPCMSKYKHLYSETANGSLNQLSFI
jgi:hypothetical protein